MVFDRWGELVHSTQNFPASSLDPSHGWDGRFQGKNVNPGVYVYYAEIQMMDGSVSTRKGDLTLLR